MKKNYPEIAFSESHVDYTCHRLITKVLKPALRPQANKGCVPRAQAILPFDIF